MVILIYFFQIPDGFSKSGYHTIRAANIKGPDQNALKCTFVVPIRHYASFSMVQLIYMLCRAMLVYAVSQKPSLLVQSTVEYN